MVANLNRLPVKRAHHAKRYDAKRDAQLDTLAVVAPPPAAPAPPVPPPAAAPPAPPAVPPAAPPAPAPTTSATPSATPLVSAPLPVVKPVSAVSSAKTGSTGIGGSPSPVPSATRLVVKPLTSSFSRTPASALPPSSSSVGHPNSAIASNSKGLSGGGIAGIIIGIIFFFLGVFLFVKRRRAMMARKGKRNWERDLFPKHDEPSEKSTTDPPMGQYAFQGQAAFPAVSPITPLSASYNNPTYLASVPPSAASGGQMISSATDVSGKPIAIIRCTFIPSLPDELSITTGETVTILNEYDDGWALCANVRGEQGMVPLECLAKDAATPRVHESDWKNAQRASSLIFRDGVRY